MGALHQNDGAAWVSAVTWKSDPSKVKGTRFGDSLLPAILEQVILRRCKLRKEGNGIDETKKIKDRKEEVFVIQGTRVRKQIK
jgi:hypothetical protein